MAPHFEAPLNGQSDICEGVITAPNGVEGILQVLGEVVPLQAVLLIVHLKQVREFL